MADLEIKNATIASTMLGVEDHGILTCFLYLDGDGWGGGFGGYGFDEWDANQKRRIAHVYGLEFVLAVLRVVGVGKWEDLKGKAIRVETSGLGGRITRIGNLIKEDWFDPKALAALHVKAAQS